MEFDLINYNYIVVEKGIEIAYFVTLWEAIRFGCYKDVTIFNADYKYICGLK